jgi:hypothetical protein
MKQAFSFRLTHLHERSIRLTLMMVVLATVIMGVMVFGALPFTPTAHANDVDTLTFVSPNSSHSCSPGNQGQISAPQSAINGCDTRVFVFSTDHESGSSLCISPNTSTGTFHTRWLSFKVTSNTSRC